MSKPPSAETQLRSLKREIKEIRSRWTDAEKRATEYRIRATSAEQQCAEWKQRFDVLLRREDKP